MTRFPLIGLLFLVLSNGTNPGLVLSSQPICTAVSDSRRIIVYFRERSSARIECFVFSEGGVELPINKDYVTVLNPYQMETYINACIKQQRPSSTSHRRHKRAIFPGTKWCGINNIAKSYVDLGKQRQVDSCCREHDHCDLYIKPFRYKYGLFNFAFFTSSHCKCDRKFRDCLKQPELSKNIVAKIIYNLYFKFLRIRCFEQKMNEVCIRYWLLFCLERRNVFRWTFSSVV